MCTRPTSSTPTAWPRSCTTAPCLLSGSPLAHYATNASSPAPGCSQAARTVALSKVRTMLKNRMHSTLAKYALSLDTDSDIFSRKWRAQLLDLLRRLPGETQRWMQQELELLDQMQEESPRPGAS